MLKTPKPATLPIPSNTDDTSNAANLAAKMQAIATDARFNSFGIGVVDFNPGVNMPRVWLLNEGTPWRIASAGKLAILLAAVQLRDDVRRVKATGLISTPAEWPSDSANVSGSDIYCNKPSTA